MTPLLFLSILGLLPIFVSAHGYIKSVTIDGQVYSGNEPGGTTNPSVIRQVSTISPVKGSTNPSMNCGMNATLAANVANANPGSQLQVHWVGGSTGDSNWPHTVGPVMHYMTKCSGSCSSFDSTNAKWFKISQLGVEPNDSSWYQGSIAEGVPANVTIPSNISPGGFLLRSELISLQIAVSLGGAEFYPACIQLNIGGSGTGAATDSEECAFPGCYADTDPGILDPTVYDPPITYTFPGPPVAAFVGTGGSEGGTQPNGTTNGSSATSPTPSTNPASGIPTNTSSPSSTNTTMPTPNPSTHPSGNLNAVSGTSCYVTSPTNLLAKRGNSKRRTHKRRLVRRGT